MASLRALCLLAIEHDAVLDLVIQPAPLRIGERHENVLLLGLEVLSSASERAPRASPRYEGVDPAARLSPDLRSSAVEMGVVVAPVLSQTFSILMSL